MIQCISCRETQTEQFGECLAAALRPGDVIAFRGGLGMGKTALTRGLARGLGYGGRVTSPTFTIVNEYSGGRLELFHFDFYRLHDAAELLEIGWDEYLERGGVCVVEWSEQIPDILPPDTIYITLSRCENPFAEENFPRGCESLSTDGNFSRGCDNSSTDGNFLSGEHDEHDFPDAFSGENNFPGTFPQESDFLSDSHSRFITLEGLDDCPERNIFPELQKIFPDWCKERGFR